MAGIVTRIDTRRKLRTDRPEQRVIPSEARDLGRGGIDSPRPRSLVASLLGMTVYALASGPRSRRNITAATSWATTPNVTNATSKFVSYSFPMTKLPTNHMMP